MAVVTVNKRSYTVDSLYQWDIDQTLEIRGLSLPSIPAIHFSNTAMSAAIVRQATMDAAGVIRAEIPNSLLQKAYNINAYICLYSGNTFETKYKIQIPVKARTRPGDYTIEDTDGELYSFIELENQIANAVTLVDGAADTYNEAADKVIAECNGLVDECETRLDEYGTKVDGYEAQVQELIRVASGIVASELTLSAAWEGDGPYYQTVALDGVTANSKIDLQLSAEQLQALFTGGTTALSVENDNGALTVKALGAAPDTEMTIQCTITEVVTA